MLNVPRGTISKFTEQPDELIERLEIYAGALQKWNSKINLISANSLGELWERHFLDSLQLNTYVPRETSTALDIGSGGGFPALVLAAANPHQKWTFVESDQRKSVFLRSTAREMGLTITVISNRIEEIEPFSVDLITARALANLPKLLDWCCEFVHKDTVMIFPKGKAWEKELTLARQSWQMETEIYESLTQNEARIFVLRKVRKLQE